MKKILVSLAMMILGVSVAVPVQAASLDNAIPADVTADSAGCDDSAPTFFGMRPWFYGLERENGCKDIVSDNFKTGNLQKTITIIILNIVHDIMMIVGVLATGFLLFGAYRYIRAGGDPGMLAKGKRTITTAIIGLVISLLAEIIVNSIGKMLTNAGATAAQYGLYNIDPDTLLQTAVSFVLGLLTLVAVGFAIASGYQMVTAGGDPSRLQKGKSGLTTAVIGIIIAILGFSITNFVMVNVRESSVEGDIFATVENIFGVVVGVIGFVAVCGIVWGGVQYMTAGGDATKLTKAKNAVIWSVVGLAIAVIGGIIVSFVIRALDGLADPTAATEEETSYVLEIGDGENKS